MRFSRAIHAEIFGPFSWLLWMLIRFWCLCVQRTRDRYIFIVFFRASFSVRLNASSLKVIVCVRAARHRPLCAVKALIHPKIHTIYSFIICQRTVKRLPTKADMAAVWAHAHAIEWFSIFSPISFMYSSTLTVADVTSLTRSECTNERRTPHPLTSERKQTKITISICW